MNKQVAVKYLRDLIREVESKECEHIDWTTENVYADPPRTGYHSGRYRGVELLERVVTFRLFRPRRTM